MRRLVDILAEPLPLVPPEGGRGSGPLLIGYDFHPDEPNQRVLADYLAEHPIAGTELLQFHPHAAEQGVRFLGEAQMSCYFPGDAQSSNPEEAAAGRASEFIAQLDPWLVPVLHDSKTTSYAVVGPRTTRAALGLVTELGITNVMVSNYPFSRVMPRSVNLEIGPNSPLADPVQLHGTLQEVSKLGENGLAERFDAQKACLTLYQSAGVVKVQEMPTAAMEALEGFGTTLGKFDELRLPSGLLYEIISVSMGEVAAKACADGVRMFADTWGYNNFSKPLSEQGDGVKRREIFGGLLVEAHIVLCEEPWVDIRSPLGPPPKTL